MSYEKKLVDLCPNCGDTHTANHPGGRCYLCGEKTRTVPRKIKRFIKVGIDPKKPHEEIVREFEPYFGQLAAKIGLEKARWLEDNFYSEIFDQRWEGKEEIIVYLPFVEP